MSRKDARGLVDVIARTRLPNDAVFISWAIKLPAFLDGEFRTHRQQSKGAASFRARTTASMIRDVLDDPFIRWHHTMNEPGMQGHTAAPRAVEDRQVQRIKSLRLSAVDDVQQMAADGLHKQDCNRYLQPWSWMQWIVTTRESHLPHFFGLRDEAGVEPHMRDYAREMRRTMEEAPIVDADAHLPYISDEDRAGRDLVSCAYVSSVRCRRVSLFRLGDGSRSTFSDDVNAGVKMARETPPHATPFEHQVWTQPPGAAKNLAGNFAEYDADNWIVRDGTVQFRKWLGV